VGSTPAVGRIVVSEAVRPDSPSLTYLEDAQIVFIHFDSCYDVFWYGYTAIAYSNRESKTKRWGCTVVSFS
jgi:hypothetical protein